MSMTTTEFERIAEELDLAAQTAEAVDQISLTTSFTEDEAYEIQRLSIQRRIDRGETLIGLKLGFTSFAKMEQMGVHDMIWGRLTDAMLLEGGGELELSKFIHPRAEPEICFRMAQDVDHEITRDEVLDYVDAMAPAIEVIDSRYQNFKFSLEDVIADNCSSSALVVGDWMQLREDLTNLNITLSFNDEVKEQGSSNDILGDPWLSVVHAIRLSLKYNQPLRKGDILMAGAATSAVFIQPGTTIKAEVEGMGPVQFNVA